MSSQKKNEVLKISPTKMSHKFEISPGTQICDLIVGKKIGFGSFGAIYPCVDSRTGILWAMKTESLRTKHKTLEFEYQVLSELQTSPYFPRIGIFGKNKIMSFFTMECMGPSLSTLLHSTANKRFTLSTSIRASYHILKCIESLHQLGFIHRDIKPSNIVTREGIEHPICLIDFGLSHVFVNPETGQHLRPRLRAGFRGTRVYSSINGHRLQDLSRRDDVISWFYFAYELIVGELPWYRVSQKYQFIQEKEKFSEKMIKTPPIPELGQIWEHISKLEFLDIPNYTQIYHLLMEILRQRSDKEIDIYEPFDWAECLKKNRQATAEELKELKSNNTKHAIDHVMEKDYGNDLIDHHLISPQITAPAPFSQASDKNDCCCFIS
ncbi:CK1 family protein kinase [Tritrichomonas foetus]|uniref:non-specific serine/threonine protein kinase n=1 Tax=Tritrichomonas foetus TaxID=1144522 RepID=A0A1J4KX26_9EUKA|nr:CK1 family protein kinase [Tritrichomonas foetus]|eukprot:OHT15440.1 CK1 family protein kinase [Tritrichomonas foetus]